MDGYDELRNVVEDVLDNESSRIISDSSFISDPFGFYDQNDVKSDKIPTSDEDIHKSSSSEIDDYDEDKDLARTTYFIFHPHFLFVV
ncbi:hypothetical protein J6590_064552 [Homalodisca vitripennis]|nr:hypothetical protein J6590_064552 [Homalodisca vitripennis]